TANSAQTAAAGAQTTADGAVTKANAAQTSANKAETDAQTGITKANAAQTTADTALAAANAAQATADSKVSDAGQHVGGTSTAATGGTILAGATCGTGQKVTGGGYTLLGSDNDQAQVTLNSQLYPNSWIIQAKQQAGQAG